MEENKVKIVILAGGKCKRMQSNLPKGLFPIKGKPMIKHLLESIEKSGIDPRPVVVVGYKKELVIDELGEKYNYAIQEEQLGTGHAVLSAKEKVGSEANHVLVLYGDNPFMTAETMKKIVEEHLKSETKITMATVELPDFQDWRAFFYTNFSRIVRDENSEIVRSVEFKDASEEEKRITEVNPCYFCFEAKWLWKSLEKIENNNSQKEYYLTDLIGVAIKEGEKINSIAIEPKEALAANSQEELELLEKFAI